MIFFVVNKISEKNTKSIQPTKTDPPKSSSDEIDRFLQEELLKLEKRKFEIKQIANEQKFQLEQNKREKKK